MNEWLLWQLESATLCDFMAKALIIWRRTFLLFILWSNSLWRTNVSQWVIWLVGDSFNHRMFQEDGRVGQINQCFEVNDHWASWQAASWISFIIGCRCCWSRSTANVMALSNLTVNYEKQRWPDRKGDKVHLLDKKYVQKKLSSGSNKLVDVFFYFKSDE